MFADFLIERFLEQPRQPAVLAPAGSSSFGELAASVGKRASELEAAGLGAGPVVALEGDFSPEAIALFLALTQVGAILVPERTGNPAGRERREKLAEVEAAVRVDRAERTQIETTGRRASNQHYEELRSRQRPGLVQFSSGTTGEPKAAVHDLAPLLEKFRVRRPALRSLALLFFDHMGGINTMLHTLSNGAALVSSDDRSPDGLCALIEQHEVELLPATPTLLNMILLSGAHRRHNLSSLQTISYGAEAMAPVTLERLHQAFPGVSLRQTYGMIELGVMRTRSRGDDSLWVQVGGEDVETRVRDGILQVRCRSMLLGYLNATAPIDDEGWFSTGDMVEQDGEYLRFLGRESDLINVGGEKVFPAEVEGAIESMDGVIEATVHGEQNSLLGQVVCARVSVIGGAEPADVRRQVKRFCRERLERFKVPVRVEVATGEEGPADIKKPRPRETAGGPS